MDNEVRDLQRTIVAGDTSLLPRFISALRRSGRKPKLRAYHTRELGIHVRMSAHHFGEEIFWNAVQFPPRNGLRPRAEPVWRCTHHHKTRQEAGKCAKRRGYCIILHDDALLLKYIDVSRS